MLGMFRRVGLSAVSAVALLAASGLMALPQTALAGNECLLDTDPLDDDVATAGVDSDGAANASGSARNTACGPSANASSTGTTSENSAFGYNANASGGTNALPTFNTAIGTGADASSDENS